MENLLVRGGARLKGEVTVSGAKNAALPAMAASLLSAGTLHLERVPDLVDVKTMGRLLESMGVKYRYSDGSAGLDASKVRNPSEPGQSTSTSWVSRRWGPR
jgi:UDP-N-acetylglucosamine 1-carboxyvinyltransferase